jgi:two-component system, response regulator
MPALNLHLPQRSVLSDIIPANYLVYADDDLDDQYMFKETLLEHHPEIALIMCADGKQLFDFLTGLRPSDPYPSYVILDMNMPLWNGIRTLRELKNSNTLKHLKVIMFTTSSAATDREQALHFGAHAFVTKPVRHTDLVKFTHRFSMAVTLQGESIT